jgi:hypothetical protein
VILLWGAAIAENTPSPLLPGRAGTGSRPRVEAKNRSISAAVQRPDVTGRKKARLIAQSRSEQQIKLFALRQAQHERPFTFIN